MNQTERLEKYKQTIELLLEFINQRDAMPLDKQRLVKSLCNEYQLEKVVNQIQ